MSRNLWTIRIVAAASVLYVCATFWPRRQGPLRAVSGSEATLASARDYVEGYRVAVEITCWENTDAGLAVVAGVQCSMHSHNGRRNAEGVLWIQEALAISDQDGRAKLVAATAGRKTIVARAEGMMPVIVDDTVVAQFSPTRSINIVLDKKQERSVDGLTQAFGGEVVECIPRYKHVWPSEGDSCEVNARVLERRVPDGWPHSVIVRRGSGEVNVVWLDDNGKISAENECEHAAQRQSVRIVQAAPCANESPVTWTDVVAELAVPYVAQALPEVYRQVQFKSLFPFEYVNIRIGPMEWCTQTNASCRASVILPSIGDVGLVRMVTPGGRVGSWAPFSLLPSRRDVVGVGRVQEDFREDKDGGKDGYIDLLGVDPVPKRSKGTVVFQAQRRNGAIVRRGTVGSDGGWTLRGIPRTAKGWVQLLITDESDVTCYLRLVSCRDRVESFGIVRLGRGSASVEVDTNGLALDRDSTGTQVGVVELRNTNGRYWCSRKVPPGSTVVVEGMPEGVYQLVVKDRRGSVLVADRIVVSGARTRIDATCVTRAASDIRDGRMSKGGG